MPEATWARRSDGNWTRVCNITEPAAVDCVHPEFLPSDRYKLAVYGYVMPALVFLTVVTNCLVCAVLLRRSMRTPTNVLLVAMAVSDMLTGLSTMPAFIKFFTLGAYVDYMPYKWFVAVPFFWATVCKTVRPMLSDRCLFVCLFSLGRWCIVAKQLDESR